MSLPDYVCPVATLGFMALVTGIVRLLWLIGDHRAAQARSVLTHSGWIIPEKYEPPSREIE